MVRYRVRENTRTIKGAPGHSDHTDYWVYCHNGYFFDYYEALKFAVEYSKERYPCWVEALTDSE